ncbi:MAG TPA: heparinase II/III family protein [Bryobacteraceae bacterium]|nr:heparinase II/III family protein [Bryobacteraceae bacterium]
MSQPAVMHDDFQDDSLGQWASYPPVQDIGYDPSLSPTTEYAAPGGRALMRVYQPVSPGLMRVGFIKRLDMLATGTVTMTFSYRLKPVTPGAVLEIGLAGADGHRYKASITVEPRDGWAHGSAEFRDIPPGTGLQAVYITANVSHPDTDAEYRFLIDNVSLQAAKAVRFEVREPHSIAISPFPAMVSSATYTPGETISIAAASNVSLSKASFVLKDQDRRAVKASPLTLQEAAWVDRSAYTVQATDPTGVWHLELRGVTPDGRTMETEVRLIVRPPRSSVHPRLYFDSQDRAALLARTQEPKERIVWDRLIALAKSARGTGDLSNGGRFFRMLDPRFLLPTLTGYFDVLNRASNRILFNSLEAYVSGSEEARRAAKSALLAVAGWDTWVPPWFAAHGQYTYYPAGELTGDVAFGYDTLYDTLSNSERELVRHALIEHGIKPAYKEYVLDNRAMADTSNWIGHVVGGGVLASLAVMGAEDDPELNTYLGGLLIKLENHLAASYLSDGSYGEGISYQEFDLKSTTLALSALARVDGIDYWPRTFVKDSLHYPLYLLAHPVRDGFDMGDSHTPSGYSIAAVIQHSADPVMHWYYDQFEHRSITDFLFPPDNIAPQPPSKPVSRVFDQKGNVVFRTGWAPDDAILLFRAGPNFNHNHGDQGGFLLRALEENLVVEGGYADYYKDPYYRTYFSQSAGHNTVLIDGDPGSQEVADTRQFLALNAHPIITDAITSDSFDAVGSELASVYRGRLKTFSRRIVFLKPDTVIVYDDLAGNSPATFDWLLHVKDREKIQVSPGGALYSGAKASMSLKTIAPSAATIRVKDGYLPYTAFAPLAPKTVPAQPGVIHIESGPARTARFLISLSIASSAERATAMAAEAQKATGSGCIGVRLGAKLVMFRDRTSSTARYEEWQTNAQMWSSVGQLVAASAVTSLERAGKPLLEGDRPISFVAVYRPNAVDVSIFSGEPVTLRLFTGFRPAGTQAGDYDEKQKITRMRLPAGRRELSLHP